jgi:hypothetical protein
MRHVQRRDALTALRPVALSQKGAAQRLRDKHAQTLRVVALQEMRLSARRRKGAAR